MIHRVASVLLVLVLVSAGGSDPFARVPRRNQRPRVMPRGAGRLVDTAEIVRLRGHTLITNTLVGDRHHHQLATVADVRPSVRVGATSALVEVGEAGVVPELPGQPVPVAANTRPNRPPRVVLSARAPPA